MTMCLRLPLGQRIPFLGLFLGGLLLLGGAAGQQDGPGKLDPEYFDKLSDLDKPALANRIGRIGSQNFTRCCLQAVREWHDGERDQVSIWSNDLKPTPFDTPDELASSEEQFPCGASWDGNIRGAATVSITYNWCASRCGGWQQSVNRVLSQWVQPFVGFILPAAVFCLNVPRRMVFDIADELFPDVLERLKYSWIYLLNYPGASTYWGTVVTVLALLLDIVVNVALVAVRAIIAASLGLLNVVVWVIVVFSTAAPMILSGLYEAAIDRQVLHAIERRVRPWKMRHVKNPTLHPANDVRRIPYEVHLLYAVLVGNLEVWVPRKKPTRGKKAASAAADEEKGQPNSEKVPSLGWRHVDALVKNTLSKEKVHQEDERKATEVRLNTMLECQASFGATIGAPIAFFLGSFLFSVFSNISTLGDNDTSHALAFGEWWMTIPHIAIVSGCLLAGNNPYTLEAVMSGLKLFEPRPEASTTDTNNATATSSGQDAPEFLAGEIAQGIVRVGTQVTQTVTGFRKSYTFFYKSLYQPVWMWERGRSKRNWIKEVQNLYREEIEALPVLEEEDTVVSVGEGKTLIGKFMKKVRQLWEKSNEAHPLEKVPALGTISWGSLLITASILIIIPWVLAYVTSFYTPTIGLSCRTFTFVMYFIFQLILTFIWFADFSREQGFRLHTAGGYPTPFYIFVILCFLGSAFTAIVGTFLQIVGVYRNCLCSVPISAWASGEYNMVISTNSAEMIYFAGVYWLSTGVASIVLLIFFCYLGWWYQRHWRARLGKVVKDVLMTNSAKELRELHERDKREKRARAQQPRDEEVVGGPSTEQPASEIKEMTPAVRSDTMEAEPEVTTGEKTATS